MLTLIRRCVVVGLSVSLLVACGGGKPALEAGTLYASVISDPKSLNPLTAREVTTTDILGFVFEGLIRSDPQTYEIEPSLADTWSVSPDGSTWTFRLRRDVTFQDGHPLTARDVDYTFNRLILNPAVQCGLRDLWQVEGRPFEVSLVDTWTITVNTHKPFAPLLRVIGAPILPEHLYGKIEDFNQALGINTPVDQIVGTGPFRIAEFQPGVRVVLAARTDYWQKDDEGQPLPRIKKIIISVVSDADAEIEWFRAQKTDFAMLRGHDWPVFSQNPVGYKLWNMGPRFVTTFIFFNQNLSSPISPAKQRWFRDRAFREAVAWAVDRPTIVQSVYNGLAFAQQSSISEANRIFHDSSVITAYGFDIARASKILEDAGYRRGEDGKLRDPQGEKVAFELTTNANNNERVRGAVVIAEALRQLGMDVTVNPMDFNALVDHLDNDLQWEACVMGLTESLEPHNGSNIWRVEGDLHMFNQMPHAPAEDADPVQKRDYAARVAKWRNGIQPWEREIEKLMAQGSVTLDLDRRKQIYSRVQAIASRELPFVYTVAPAALYATRDRIEGVEPSPAGSTAIAAVLHTPEILRTR